MHKTNDAMEICDIFLIFLLSVELTTHDEARDNMVPRARMWYIDGRSALQSLSVPYRRHCAAC